MIKEKLGHPMSEEWVFVMTASTTTASTTYITTPQPPQPPQPVETGKADAVVILSLVTAELVRLGLVELNMCESARARVYPPTTPHFQQPKNPKQYHKCTRTRNARAASHHFQHVQHVTGRYVARF
jgi:hypothetical protein